jgi:hypothetical protein
MSRTTFDKTLNNQECSRNVHNLDTRPRIGAAHRYRAGVSHSPTERFWLVSGQVCASTGRFYAKSTSLERGSLTHGAGDRLALPRPDIRHTAGGRTIDSLSILSLRLSTIHPSSRVAASRTALEWRRKKRLGLCLVGWFDWFSSGRLASDLHRGGLERTGERQAFCNATLSFQLLPSACGLCAMLGLSSIVQDVFHQAILHSAYGLDDGRAFWE